MNTHQLLRRLILDTGLCLSILITPGIAAAQSSPQDHQQAAENERDVSWKKLAPNALSDQKRIWTTYPARLARRDVLLPTLAVAAATAGLILADRSEGAYFHRTDRFHDFNQAFSSRNTAIATVLVPVSFYGAGLVRRDQYAQNTALLAGEAAVASEVVALVIRDATQRLRPQNIPVNGNYGDTWWETHSWTGGSSFPSGHAIAAFSIATVYARRYGRQHRWVPYVAYGSAALIGLSRLTTNSHYSSDVFLGAALGYGIGRFAVLR